MSAGNVGLSARCDRRTIDWKGETLPCSLQDSTGNRFLYCAVPMCTSSDCNEQQTRRFHLVRLSDRA